MMKVQQTADMNGNAVGARVPPSCCAKLCLPSCAISGYEAGDPITGCCQGKALLALILETCCLGWCVACVCWSPAPENIRGDSTQRTIDNKCCAACLLGHLAIHFWESGDMFYADGKCTWCYGDGFVACLMCCIPTLLGIGPLDTCYVCCCWQANHGYFKRSTLHHGGGQPLAGAPVQMAGIAVSLREIDKGQQQQMNGHHMHAPSNQMPQSPQAQHNQVVPAMRSPAASTMVVQQPGVMVQQPGVMVQQPGMMVQQPMQVPGMVMQPVVPQQTVMVQQQPGMVMMQTQ